MRKLFEVLWHPYSIHANRMIKTGSLPLPFGSECFVWSNAGKLRSVSCFFFQMKLSAYANKNLLQGDIVRTQPYSTLQLLTAKGTFIKKHGVFRGWPKTQVITCFTLHHKKQIKIAMPISRFLALIPLINFPFLVLFPSKCFNRSFWWLFWSLQAKVKGSIALWER